MTTRTEGGLPLAPFLPHREPTPREQPVSRGSPSADRQQEQVEEVTESKGAEREGPRADSDRGAYNFGEWTVALLLKVTCRT